MSKLLLDVAEDLVDHLHTYKLDPENLTIGLHPSEVWRDVKLDYTF